MAQVTAMAMFNRRTRNSACVIATAALLGAGAVRTLLPAVSLAWWIEFGPVTDAGADHKWFALAGHGYGAAGMSGRARRSQREPFSTPSRNPTMNSPRPKGLSSASRREPPAGPAPQNQLYRRVVRFEQRCHTVAT